MPRKLLAIGLSFGAVYLTNKFAGVRLWRGRCTLIGPSALSAPPALKHVGDNSAVRFHDRFEESEFSSAEAAVMV